ncbi:MAG: glycosyltransferase family 2 protein, partial [Methylocapsa sp.]|nr:glycosyltransferase family 2 protein [Methylocapsa sp.]
QYRVLWIESRPLWVVAALGVSVPIVAAATALSLALEGDAFAAAAIGASLVLGDIRYRARRKIVAALWGTEALTKNQFYWRVERWLRPLWWSFHALCIFSALGSRHIRWAGVDYTVRGPQDIEVERVPPPKEKV